MKFALRISVRPNNTRINIDNAMQTTITMEMIQRILMVLSFNLFLRNEYA